MISQAFVVHRIQVRLKQKPESLLAKNLPTAKKKEAFRFKDGHIATEAFVQSHTQPFRKVICIHAVWNLGKNLE